jgi:CheY-like chemotaxis protein/HPt (histidine-containing phosphotransfer) domain-containing protein
MSRDDTAGRVRILVAEDDAVNQQVAVSLLRRRGYEVDAVPNGLEAVEAVRKTRYDVVLMDIQMPVMGGREATRRIRDLPGSSDLPVVALTGQDLPDERRRCEAAGMSGFLPKPYEPSDLYHAVERWIAEVGVGSDPGGEPMMNEGTPPVDIEAFRSMMREGGIEEIVESTLEMYREESEPTFAALKDAVASGDAEGIQRSAHALKSSSGTIRADRLAELLRRLEALGSSGDVDGAADLLPDVAREYHAVMDFLAG